MARRVGAAVFAGLLATAGLVLPGTAFASGGQTAKIPAVCVHRSVGHLSIEAGYCPNG